MIAKFKKYYNLTLFVVLVCTIIIFCSYLGLQKSPLLLAKFKLPFQSQELSTSLESNNNTTQSNLDLEVSEKKPESRASSTFSQAELMQIQVIEENKTTNIEPEPFKVSDQILAPVLIEIPTEKPVIFLGIDDGQVLNEEARKFLISKKWPVTLFINKKHYDSDKKYFQSILDAGAVLGDHTSNHPNLVKYNYEQQKIEICGSQKDYQLDFGITPKLFRPPYGNFNNATKQAVKDCGMIALINWKARVEDGMVYYQQGDKLIKGQIVLMHFVPSVLEDLKAFEAEITKQGLVVGNLNEWVI
jgi:hypothetical protein